MKSVAVIGGEGQLGTDLVKFFDYKNWNVISVSHKDLSVENFEQSLSYFRKYQFNVVINTAALHNVDKCEKNPLLAWEINAKGSSNIAQISKEINAKYIYVSTDYVFDGNKGAQYKESDSVGPINVYGASKAAGEIATLSVNEENIVIRISSVFGSAGCSGKGGNFVESILKKAAAGESLNVVSDIFMSPSYTKDVALKLFSLIERGARGIFHLNNEGRISWYDFAKEICKQAGYSVRIDKTSTDPNAKLTRPVDSSLSTSTIDSLGIPQRSWNESLSDYLVEKGHI